jgi:hypothetical protein
VQCTRPWKVDQCKTLTASYAAQESAAWGGKLSILCSPASDPTFEQGRIKAIEIAGQLNHKAGGAAIMATAAAESGAGCKPTWDPLSISCKDHKALAKQIEALPGLGLAACAADPNKDGADGPCIVPILTVGDTVETVSTQQPVAAALLGSRGVEPRPPTRTVMPLRPALAKAPRAEARDTLPAEPDPPQDARTPAASTWPVPPSPPSTLGTPRAGSRAPDWHAVGGSNSPAVQSPARLVTPTLPGGVASADVDVTRQMNALACLAEQGALRFRCATRAGLERCEALRAQRKLDRCTLHERR